MADLLLWSLPLLPFLHFDRRCAGESGGAVECRAPAKLLNAPLFALQSGSPTGMSRTFAELSCRNIYPFAEQERKLMENVVNYRTKLREYWYLPKELKLGSGIRPQEQAHYG
jgi:hypothetical protein